jgi:hypothetical protein
MEKYPKSITNTPLPSKHTILSWIKSILPDLTLNLKIEDFGDGVLYSRLLTYYYGLPTNSKIILTPKN